MLPQSIWILSAILILLLRNRVSADGQSSRLPRDVIPSPVVVPSSQDWGGNDGSWSTFVLQVGTPAQIVKVLISTASYQTAVVLPGGCVAIDPSNCGDLRGGTFFPNTSSTWVNNTADPSTNIYPLNVDSWLGYSGKAALGFDDISLGWLGSGAPAMKNQTLATFINKDFYLGYFGVKPLPSNFTTFNDPIPSFMQNLVNQSKIPSTTWAYTSGNQYRFNQVLGSLVLGGYDASRFIASSLTWPFGPQDIHDLSVNIEMITMSDSNTNVSLLPTSVSAFLDSTLPYIWLPIEACALFEKEFGLTWDETSLLYLINDTQHNTLLSQNANITFTLGNFEPGQTVNITLPYSAWDLEAQPPLVANTTKYFPLKRATNSTQYTLGRTFFQEAYVIADYDRQNFSVHQCSWVADAQQTIVTIFPPSENTTLGSSASPNSNPNAPSHGISTGVVVGIAVGLVVIVGILASIYYILIMKPRRQKAKAKARAETQAAASAATAISANTTSPATDPAGVVSPLSPEDSVYVKAELDAQERQLAQEIGAEQHEWISETDGQELHVHEMETGKNEWIFETDGREIRAHELPAREEVAAELLGEDRRHEMAAREEVATEMNGLREPAEIESPEYRRSHGWI